MKLPMFVKWSKDRLNQPGHLQGLPEDKAFRPMYVKTYPRGVLLGMQPVLIVGSAIIPKQR